MMTREELTAAATEYDFEKYRKDGDYISSLTPTDLADFAALMLEREGVYREICEAAWRVDFNDGTGKYKATVMLEKDGTYWAIRLPGNETIGSFATLEEAYAWVKEGKDGE